MGNEVKTRGARKSGPNHSNDTRDPNVTPYPGKNRRISQEKKNRGVPVNAPGKRTEPAALPPSYGETRIVLFPIEPYALHAFWEISSEDHERVRKRLGKAYGRAKAILRFHDASPSVSESSEPGRFFDVEIEIQAGKWYVSLWSPEKSYVAEVGFMTEKGRFFSLARSETIRTPPAHSSLRGAAHHLFVSQDAEKKIWIRTPFPVGELRGEFPLDTLRRKLTETYASRGCPAPSYRTDPSAQGESYDLTEHSERMFSTGASSK